MPKFYMLIGVPGSGKSTWVKNNISSDTVVLSTDAYIEAAAASAGKTYTDVFNSQIKNATSKMNADLASAIKGNRDIVWDQTNISSKSRKSKLASIPDSYHKIAVFFVTPNDLEKRLASRPGKNIPFNVLQGMISMLEVPTKEEGFDQIVVNRY